MDEVFITVMVCPSIDPMPRVGSFEREGQARSAFSIAAAAVAEAHNDKAQWDSKQSEFMAEAPTEKERGHVWGYACGCAVVLHRCTVVKAQ